MEHLELVLFGIAVAVVALIALAQRLSLPYPILLVVGGSALGFVPGMPSVELTPDLVLVLFLPPLLFNAAYFSSLRDLRQNLRPIGLSAVGLTLGTMCAVAVALHAAVDGLPWAAAFALGAVVGPTDPLAATAIAGRLGVPRRIVAIIEGESLVNDGVALVAYAAAVEAASTGQFSLPSAGLNFVVDVAGGVAVGLVAAVLIGFAFKRVVGDALLSVSVSLLAGYAAYLPAEELGVSGVLAAVTVGLTVGYRAPMLSNAAGRLSGYAFWDVLVFALNATLFVLVGLQLPQILADQDRRPGELEILALLAGGVVILTRLVWANTMPFVIRALDRRPTQLERRIGWRSRMVIGWSGMRGAVSLAAALAIPATTLSGAPFPERDLLVFLALAVIFATLVLQGLTLPPLIRRLGVVEDAATAREQQQAREVAAAAALERLDQLRTEPWIRREAYDRMVGLYDFRRRRLAQRVGEHEDDEDLEDRSLAYQRLVREVLDAQRRAVVGLRDSGAISDEVMREVERELDLEDERLEI